MPQKLRLRLQITELLSATANEIFGVVERTLAEYEEKIRCSQRENARQRVLLDTLLNPKIQLRRTDPVEFTSYVSKEEVPPEQQHCEQERSSSLDQENPEPSQIKEKQEELCTSQDGEQLQDLKEEETDTDDSMLTFPVSGDGFQNMFSQHFQSQSVDNIKRDPIATTSTEPYGEDCGGPEPTTDSQPPSSDCSVAGGVDRGQSQAQGNSCPKKFRNHDPKDPVSTRTVENPYSCSVCGKCFHRKSYVKYHLTTHTGDKPHKCSVCFKGFINKGCLTTHMATHTGEKPFACSVCSKVFIDKGSLTRHMRTHTGEKPFTCSVCGKGFIEKEYLRSHMRSHTGEKPFTCSVCGKRFRLRGSLAYHILTHTGEKPFMCSVCGKCFNFNCHLKNHMKIHTRERPFTCSVCAKGFNEKSSWTKHMVTHTEEKPYVCSV